MRTLFIFSLVLSSFLFISNQLQAQDIIVMRTGEEEQAKIQEVTQTEIKYKKYGNLDGPQYTINKSEVFMIK